MRRQLPVYSPLGPGSILTAAAAALTDSAGEVAAFRAELRQRFGADAVVLTGSGTEALQLVLERLPSVGPSHGRIVALPGYSCYDLVTAAVGSRTAIRFYDLDPVTLAPDVDSVRAVLRAGVSAVLAANLYGYPLNWGALRSECESAGAILIEDAAQGIGTSTDQGPGGSLGTATILSFGRGKGWTGGGGGALLLRGDEASRLGDITVPEASKLTSMRSLAVTTAAWVFGRPRLYRIPTSIPGLGLGETRYREPRPPSSIPSFSAALGRRTAAGATAVIAGRLRTARRLVEDLRAGASDECQWRSCEPLGGYASASFLRLPVLMVSPQAASSLVRRGKGRGIASAYPRPLHRLPQAEPLVVPGHGRLEGSEVLASSLVTLPTHRWVRPSDIRSLSALVSKPGDDGT